MKTFNSVFTKLMTLLSKLSALLLLVMCMLVCVHVIIRGAFNSGLPGIYELVQYFMLTIVSLSLAENELSHGSIITTFILDKMKPRVANIIQTVMYSITACSLAYVLFNQIKMIGQSLHTGAKTDVLGMPHWIFVSVICIGLFFFTIAYVIRVYITIGERKSLTDQKISDDEKAANMVSASEI